MQITITATLTEEQALILAKEKGYQETITNGTLDLTTWLIVNSEPVTNPQTYWDFIKSVYENLIIEDVSRIFINYSNKAKESIRLAEEKEIKDNVIGAITSNII